MLWYREKISSVEEEPNAALCPSEAGRGKQNLDETGCTKMIFILLFSLDLSRFCFQDSEI